jgi:hypothetical protein
MKGKAIMSAGPEGNEMTNKQARLIGAAIAILGGGVAANAEQLDVSVGILLIVVAGALFIAEYIRCQKD